MDWTSLSKQVQRSIIKTSLGENAEYAKVGTLNWFPIRGNVSEQYVGLNSSTGEMYTGNSPRINVHADDIPSKPERGDMVRQRGKTYRVAEIEYDGHTSGYSLVLKIEQDA